MSDLSEHQNNAHSAAHLTDSAPMIDPIAHPGAWLKAERMKRGKSLQELIDDRNLTGTSGGSIVLSANKFTDGKRLFNYSTRFKLECDSATIPVANRYITTNPTYSTKSVDMISTCVGQD